MWAGALVNTFEDKEAAAPVAALDSRQRQEDVQDQEQPTEQETHSFVCGPHRSRPRGGLAGGHGPGVQMHVHLPVRVPNLQRRAVFIVELLLC